MDCQIKALIGAGVRDAQRCLGDRAELCRGREVFWSGSLVWVEMDGSYSVELGGALYGVVGRATLFAGAVEVVPLPGDRLRVNGRLFLVVGVFRSPFDRAFHLEAALLPR